jgi:transcription antitermination protein NusB
MSISRRRTRELLLKSLYARSELHESFDRDIFLSTHHDEDEAFMDKAYFDAMESSLLSHEKELISIIARLAPKFELSTMPVLHILFIMIALSEILYFHIEEIPTAVSVNEAIELAKKFSDEHGKAFVNGTLATFLRDKDTLLSSLSLVSFSLFS